MRASWLLIFVLTVGTGLAEKKALTQGKFGKGLNGNAGGLFVKGNVDYGKPPLTVECWARLQNKRDFNVLVAHELKTSSTHWEIYTYARSGKFSAYLPGMTPSEIVSTRNICDDRWHHVAFIYEANRARLYVDGKLVADKKIERRKGGKPQPGYLALGQLVNRSIHCDGMIDDIRISKGTREIRKPTAPLKKDKQTIALWSFDEKDTSFIDPAWTPRTDLNARYPWMKETDRDWIDARFQDMDKGPMLGATFSIPGKRRQRVFHGLSVRLGKKAAVIYDKNLPRLAAAWTGKYLMHSSRRFALLNTPQPSGTIQFATKPQTVWSTSKHSTDSKVSSQKPLDRGWARYRGLYLHGDRTILHWKIADASVLEMPGIIEKNGQTLFTRDLEIGPGKELIKLSIGEPPQAPIVARIPQGKLHSLIVQDGKGGVSHAMLSDSKAVSYTLGKTMSVQIPPRKQAIRLRLIHTKGKALAPNDWHQLIKDSKLIELQKLTKGGPKRWPTPLTTKGKTSVSNHGLFAVDTLTIPYENPHKALFYCSGVDFLKNGNIAMCTAHGDVWVVSGVDDQLQKLTWKRFATGMYQPLGLKVVDDVIYVLERGQITRLHDLNKDGEADYYECFNNDWYVLGEEHGFTTCLERDSKGNFYFFKTGSHSAPTGGCVLRVSKDGSKMDVYSTGFRHPNGMGVGLDDMIIGAGQEGNWIPKTRVDAYVKGGFYGDMRAHHRKKKPGTYDKPICWLPREVDNSGGGQVLIPKHLWGPLGGKMLHFSYGHCRMMLLLFERVQGQIQGGVVRLPMKFLSGICRGRFHPKDGHLYVCGLDGWQTAAVRDGCLQRVRFTKKTPAVPIAIHAHANGIRLQFTTTLDAKIASDVKRYVVEQCNYRWSAEYGSKDWSVANPTQQGRDEVKIHSARILKDGKTLFLEIPKLRTAMQTIIRYEIQSKSGEPIQGDVHHTIHRLGVALKTR